MAELDRTLTPNSAARDDTGTEEMIFEHKAAEKTKRMESRETTFWQVYFLSCLARSPVDSTPA